MPTSLITPASRYALASIVLMAAVGGSLATPVSAQSPQGWMLSRGSRVAGVDVGGLSPAAATEHIALLWEPFRDQPWVLQAGSVTVEATPAMLGLSAELAGLQEALESAQPAPKTTWDRLVRWVAPPEPTTLDLHIALDQPGFDAWITSMRAQVERPARDASIDWAARTTIPEQAGQQFDAGRWQALCDDPLTDFVPRKLILPVETVAPTVTADSLSRVEFDEPFISYTTKFDVRKQSRTHNIATAVAKWQGVVIPPHGRISFNKTVGERNAKNGFKVAPVYENRRVSEGFGGGICQVSTTLYNAALMAGLKVVQRGGHSRPCDYAPPGRDATVDWPSRDLVLENPFDFPMLVNASTEGGTVQFQLFGDNTARPSIELSEEVALLGGPGDPDMVLDLTLPVGTKKTHDAGFAGRKIVVTRIWNPGQPTESKEVVSTDRISALRGIVYYHPADGAAVAADAPTDEQLIEPEPENDGDAPSVF